VESGELKGPFGAEYWNDRPDGQAHPSGKTSKEYEYGHCHNEDAEWCGAYRAVQMPAPEVAECGG